MRIRTGVSPSLYLGLALVSLLGSSAHRVRTAHAADEIAVRTIYLTHPVDDIRRISIRGELGGPGSVLLDTNRCGLNLFGDTTICSEEPVRAIRVRIEKLKVNDPKGFGRGVYRLVGNLRPEKCRYYLTVPSGGSGNYRLAVMLDGGRVRVLSLEEGFDKRLPKPPRPTVTPPPPKPEVGPAAGAIELSRGTYTAVQRGFVVTIHARGKHPSRGFATAFQPTADDFQPPEYKLVHQSPILKMPAQETDFAVEVTFESQARVTHVRVYDADGVHRVPVQLDR